MAVNCDDISVEKTIKKKARIICNLLDTEYEVIKQITREELCWKLTESEEDDWDLLWTDNAVQTEKLTKMRSYQRINHFPGMHGICKKNYLAWNLNKMNKLFPNEYNFYPRTWVLPGDYHDFKQQINKKKIFIVKPEASSQGRGIFLIRRLEEVNLSERYVVQEYLSDPYLIEGLKFDLRIYVLITGCNPLRVFIHEDGLTRLATEAYIEPNSANFDEICMHLTNYAINKNNPKFKFNTDPEKDNIGHKRSLKSTYEYLESQGKDVQELQMKIEDIILKTVCAVQPSLAHIYRSCQPEDYTNSMCFELLGFDIIIDNNLNPILLEVNHSPSFTTDSPLDYKIKHRLITETLQIIGIKTRERKNFYKEKKNESQKKNYFFKGFNEAKEERAEKMKIAQERKEKWEASHLGGFKFLYPAENKEKYDKFLNFASQVWSDLSGHHVKKKSEELNRSNPTIKINPKPKANILKKKSNFSNVSFLKIQISSDLKSEDYTEADNDISKKLFEINKLSSNCLNGKDLKYYNQLNEIIKGKKFSISFLKNAEFNNTAIKLIKPSLKTKEHGKGYFLVPKTFDFSTKGIRRMPRFASENIRQLHMKVQTNVTL